MIKCPDDCAQKTAKRSTLLFPVTRVWSWAEKRVAWEAVIARCREALGVRRFTAAFKSVRGQLAHRRRLSVSLHKLQQAIPPFKIRPVSSESNQNQTVTSQNILSLVTMPRSPLHSSNSSSLFTLICLYSSIFAPRRGIWWPRRRHCR